MHLKPSIITAVMAFCLVFFFFSMDGYFHLLFNNCSRDEQWSPENLRFITSEVDREFSKWTYICRVFSLWVWCYRTTMLIISLWWDKKILLLCAKQVSAISEESLTASHLPWNMSCFLVLSRCVRINLFPCGIWGL